MLGFCGHRSVYTNTIAKILIPSPTLNYGSTFTRIGV